MKRRINKHLRHRKQEPKNEKKNNYMDTGENK